jgi:hypothetical protein
VIDWNLIAEFEGGVVLKGYVPDPLASKSGVTVGVGIDLGQWSEADLRGLGIAPDLLGHLRPYFGLRGASAVAALRERPLTVTHADAMALSQAVKGRIAADVIRRYNAAVHRNGLTFDALPSECQTVIVSVAFQYGNLEAGTPNFWKQVTDQRWADAFANLMDFGDRYPTRRRREAAVLRSVLAHKGATP